jgi:nucleotide-binding universal stress UspA family protein
MTELRRILCPVDLSEHSRQALHQALAMARWYQSTVTVLYVFSPAPVAAVGRGPAVFEPIVLTAADRDQLLADTKAFAEAESAPGDALEVVLREGGSPAAEILDHAASMKADLIVIGTHGRSGFERLLLGSVAEKVLRKATCAVMTVPSRLTGPASAGPAPAGPASAGPVLYRHVLCPVDFSEASARALTYAASLAERAGADLTVLHVVPHEFEYTAGIEYHARMPLEDFLKAREDALERQLSEVVAAVPATCRVDSLMTHGKPWREVLRVAADRGSDLIVMGVLGRGAVDLLLFGSTTQHVVREARCPVLTLRHA